MKFKISNVYFSLILWLPVIYSLFTIFLSGFENFLIFAFTCISIIFMHLYFLKKSLINSIFIFDVIFIFYLIYVAYNEGVGAILNYDFYCYVLMFIFFNIFTNIEIRQEFYSYEKANSKSFTKRIIIMLLLIIYSILFKDGFKTGYGSSIPILYGPFSIPHILGYLFISYYLECTIIYNKNNFLIKFIFFIGCIWTASRSAVVGILILIVYDFFSIKIISKKIFIGSVSVIFLLFLFINTNLLTNNPLYEKTLDANSTGSISSGREIFRLAAKNKYFYDTNFYQKAFGIGMSGVRNTMYSITHARIHVHNEYYNLLLGYGLLGMLLLIKFQLSMNKIYNNKLSFFFCQIFIFSLSYYNGFAMYSLLTIYFPIICLFFEKKQISLQ